MKNKCWSKLVLFFALTITARLAQAAPPWTPMGPTSETANVIIRDQNDGTLYIGTDTGVFSLAPNTTDWKLLSNDPTLSAHVNFHSLVQDSNGILYAAADAGVYKLTTNPPTISPWPKPGENLLYSNPTSLILDKTNPNHSILYAGTTGGMYALATDSVAGTTWNEVDNNHQTVYTLLQDTKSSSALMYVGTASGIYKMTENPSNFGAWPSLGNNLSSEGSIYSLLFDRSDPNNPMLYAATDSGIRRIAINAPIGTPWSNVGTLNFFETQLLLDTTDVNNPILLGGTISGVYEIATKSASHDSAWSQVGNDLSSIHALLLDSSDLKNPKLYVGTSDGVYRLYPNCGDGKTDPGETCDDANTNSGDGCSSTCQIETGFTCAGSPSTCNQCNSDPSTCGDLNNNPEPIPNPQPQVAGDGKGGTDGNGKPNSSASDTAAGKSGGCSLIRD